MSENIFDVGQDGSGDNSDYDVDDQDDEDYTDEKASEEEDTVVTISKTRKRKYGPSSKSSKASRKPRKATGGLLSKSDAAKLSSTKQTRKGATSNVDSDSDDDFDDSDNESQVEKSEVFEELQAVTEHASQLLPRTAGEEGAPMDFRKLDLKPDHRRRPLWVLPTGQIYLESFSRFYREACDFLVAIAEPVSRPAYIHEYKLTPYSLYAAVSINIETETIIEVLEKLSKVKLPTNVPEFIRSCTVSYGKAKLVLKRGELFVESPSVSVLERLLECETILKARVPKTISSNVGISTQGQSNSVVAGKAEFITSAAAKERKENLGFFVDLQIKEDEEQQIDDMKEMQQVQSKQAASIGIQNGTDGSSSATSATNDPKTNEIECNLEWQRMKKREEREVDRAAREWAELVAEAEAEGTDEFVEQMYPEEEEAEVSQKPNQLPPNTISNNSQTSAPTWQPLQGGTAGTDTVALLSQPTEVVESGSDNVYSFQVMNQYVEDVKRCALEIDFPLMEEYDFRRDSRNLPLPIELKQSTNIRSYQARSLSKMFGNGRARSGVIVLPCGAGKTLTGITACATIKRGCMVLCNSGVAAEQWRQQFLLFTSIPEDRVARFTSKSKDSLHPEGCVLLTTYHMMAKVGRRSEETSRMMGLIQQQEWGLLILDEVHVAPARLFRRVLSIVKAHCKLGLTATLVREDEKIQDLNFLIGPKLYEANWLDLTNEGFLARVMCREVRCPMTPEFYAEYLHHDSMHLKQLLFTLNPNKILACEHLIHQHDNRGDKVLVFCDNVVAIHYFAKRLKCPMIFGGTPESVRMRLLNQFQRSPIANTLIISKVGDVALDLPEANVIIQVASHFGSRRQEAQRLGRILRPKSGGRERGGFNAFFYSLVSKDTTEMYYSSKRQQYLVDQGYYFEVVSNVLEQVQSSGQNSTMLQKAEQLDLLRDILTNYAETQHEKAIERQEKREAEELARRKANGEVIQDTTQSNPIPVPQPVTAAPRPVRRTMTSIADLSGVGDVEYFEYD